MTRRRGPPAEAPPVKAPPPSRWQLFYEVIAQIPFGRVATYGQIAALAGFPRHARQVGYALAATPEHVELPWHRVLNARGEVSLRAESGIDDYQQALLEGEGVTFQRGRVDLTRFGWRPRQRG